MATIYIVVDTPTKVMHFYEEVLIALPAKNNVINLQKGRHKLSFISVEEPIISDSIVLTIEDDEYTDFCEIYLGARVNEIGEKEHDRQIEKTKQKAKEAAKEEAKKKELERLRVKLAELDAAKKKELEMRNLLYSIELWPSYADGIGKFKFGSLPGERIRGGLYGFRCPGDDFVYINPKYDEAQNFHDGLACVKKQNLWGCINKMGEVKIPFKYAFLRSIHEGLIAAVNDDNGLYGKLGFIDRYGNEIIPFVYDTKYINRNLKRVFFVDTLYQERFDFSNGLAAVCLNNKFGYIDKSGNTSIPFIYDIAYSFSDGVAKVFNNGKLFFIDKSGEILHGLTEKQHSIRRGEIVFSEGYSMFHGKEGVGFIDKNGDVVIPQVYLDAKPFMEGLAVVKNKEEQAYGFIDKTGDMIVPSQYLNAQSYSEGLAAVLDKETNKWGFIDKKGNVAIPFLYDGIVRGFVNGVAIVEEEVRKNVRKRFCINKNGVKLWHDNEQIKELQNWLTRKESRYWGLMF